MGFCSKDTSSDVRTHRYTFTGNNVAEVQCINACIYMLRASVKQNIWEKVISVTLTLALLSSARQTGLDVSEIADLGFSDKTASRVYTEWYKKTKENPEYGAVIQADMPHC